MNSVDSMFGLHVPALALQNKRGVVLANNLANVDTPGYRAQDMDVPALLRQELTVTPLHIKKSHNGHMMPIPTGIDFSLQLRSALQGSLDKNASRSSARKSRVYAKCDAHIKPRFILYRALVAPI